MTSLARVETRFADAQSPAGLHVAIDELAALVETGEVTAERAVRLLEPCLDHFLASVRMHALTSLSRIDATTWLQRLIDAVLEDIEKADGFVEMSATCVQLHRVASDAQRDVVRWAATQMIRKKHGRSSPGPRSAVEALVGFLQAGDDGAVDGLASALSLPKSLEDSQQAAAKALRTSTLPQAKAAHRARAKQKQNQRKR